VTHSILVSKKVTAEFGPRIDTIIRNTPGRLAILPFSQDVSATDAQIPTIEAAYYSRDVWEGTVKSQLSPAARAFWEIVDRAPNLRWLSVFSSGTDHQQYQPHMKRGVRLTTGAGAQAEPVSVAAVTGLLALARRLPHWWAAQQRSEWAPLLGAEVPPDLRGQTAIIVGTGYIGANIARLLQAVGMKTIGIRKRVQPTEHFDEVHPISAIDSKLPSCDWLVLACPLTPETRGLMDARRLALLRPNAGLVNVARGEVVDESALAAALAARRLGRAYLDVFTSEPLPRESPLWKLPNVMISPHNAGASTGTYARGVEIFLRNLDNYVTARAMENEATST
jgi:phosphoglycerate dehydrogenase-like enzyme